MVTTPRRYYDEKNGKWYFSVVDIIVLTTSSTNPRNYWKVLKNRLKKEGNQLVTQCNQLKMLARDGKYYLTDTADIETLTEIIKLIPGARVNDLATCFEPFIDPVRSRAHAEGASPPDRGAATSNGADAELLLDSYQSSDYIFIQAFVAGVSLSDLNIKVSPRKITISGSRPFPKETPLGIEKKDYLTQELLWLSFSRTIDLPFPIETDTLEATEKNGM